MENRKMHHRSQVAQMPIYLGKFFRMFIYQDDWNVIPMSAVIAGLVSMVVRRSMFVNMEGTLKGSLAIACVCIWNGCFNSIQVVCRERNIIKREHRSGMLITSYICAHMIYQAFLCLLQTITALIIYKYAGIKFPTNGVIFSSFYLEFAITLLLITYSADMLSLLISCIARTTTAAMTLMPFILIFQLVFSGGVFSVPDRLEPLTYISAARWGIQCIAAEAHYNDLPMETGWTMLQKFKDTEIMGEKPIKLMLAEYGEDNVKDQITRTLAEKSQISAYDSTEDNVKNGWTFFLVCSIVEAFLAMLMLKRIDKDKR